LWYLRGEKGEGIRKNGHLVGRGSDGGDTKVLVEKDCSAQGRRFKT